MPKGGHRPQCSVDGCDRPHKGLGYCLAHYERFKRNGRPGPAEIGIRGRLTDRAARFWGRVQKTWSCWIWLGSRNRQGYGTTGGFRSSLAHRAAYELAHGAPPPGETLDHLCNNPLCVNPAHLEPTSLSENLRRRHARERGELPVLRPVGNVANPCQRCGCERIGSELDYPTCGDCGGRWAIA